MLQQNQIALSLLSLYEFACIERSCEHVDEEVQSGLGGGSDGVSGQVSGKKWCWYCGGVGWLPAGGCRSTDLLTCSVIRR
jgi:hypothetical protein